MTEDRTNPTGKSETSDVGQTAVPAVNWDDSDMRTAYANVVNAASTREEVTLFFGTNLTWNPNDARQFNVKLNDRMVLNPHAAKRLWVLLGAVLKEYQKRFGDLNIEGIPAAAAAQAGMDSKNGNSAANSSAG